MPIINPGTGGGSPGPQGPQGIQGFPGFGFDGIDGEDGFPIPGSAGASGSSGVPGIQGVPGSPGEDGLNGEDSFIPGLQGIQGIQGVRGADGEDGLASDDFWPGFNPFIDDPLEQISRIQDQNLTIRPSYSAIVVGPYTINSGKHLSIGSGGRFQIFQGAPDTKAVVNALQTSDFVNVGAAPAVQVMAGLGSIFTITPKVTGKILVIVNGNIKTLGTLLSSTMRLYYGIGTPPVAGTIAPQPGAVLAPTNSAILNAVALSGTLNITFSIAVIISNLLVNTAYWFDISMETFSSAANNLVNSTFDAIEQ